jgi:hypothetical protein
VPDTQRQPLTVDEWNEAATLAAACLLIDDARLYGFVVGGPTIDRERCVEVLDQAARVGIVPTKLATEQAALDLIAEQQS